MGHKERLLDYLKENGSITSMEAITELSNTRLSEYIRQLRNDGYTIINKHEAGINKFGNKTNYDRYILIDSMIEFEGER